MNIIKFKIIATQEGAMGIKKELEKIKIQNKYELISLINQCNKILFEADKPEVIYLNEYNNKILYKKVPYQDLLFIKNRIASTLQNEHFTDVEKIFKSRF